jgi:hypothetical protein
MDKRVGVQVARGDCMGGRLDLPFLPCCYYAKKRVVLGWLRWFLYVKERIILGMIGHVGN